MRIASYMASIALSLLFVNFVISAPVAAQVKESESISEKKDEREIPEEFRKLIENTKSKDSSKGENDQSSELIEEAKKIKLINQPASTPESTPVSSPTPTDLLNNVPTQEAKKATRYRYTEDELRVFAAAGSITLALNFILYSMVKSLRVILIAAPFDLFSRGTKTDTEKLVKWKKYFIELFLLLISICAFYLYSIGEVKEKDIENIIRAALDGILLAGVIQISYVSIRAIWGWSSSCPKCRVAFSARKVNEWDEPRTTFEKVMNSTTGRRSAFERGIHHTEYACVVCGAEWRKSASYTKELTPYS